MELDTLTNNTNKFCINNQSICINNRIIQYANIRHLWQMQQVSVNT